MDEKEPPTKLDAKLELELYFMIYKFLSSRCGQLSQALRQWIEQQGLLPKRIDWQGNEHPTSLETFERNNSHIDNDHLLKICSRFRDVLDKDVPPSVCGVHSLLGAGSQSLLRRSSAVERLDKCSAMFARVNGAPLSPSNKNMLNYPSNIFNTSMAREYSGPVNVKHLIPTTLYSQAKLLKRQLGHLSSVYCITFDRSGKYIITGADDLLVKIWSALDARLLATLRGHAAEITDLAVNYENTLLAAGSCDKMIRVWCLKTTSPITVLSGHSATVTSLKFCPLSRDSKRFLVSTANDGCVCFWTWDAITNEFEPKPIKFNEKTKTGVQIITSSFSGGGSFLAVGSTDHYVRVYHITAPNGPEKILDIEAHTDQVDSLQFSNLGFRFLSGSKDGTANIWWYERQTWKSHLLNMSETLPGQPPAAEGDSKQLKLKVNMVCWTCDDAYVITAVSDRSLKMWDSSTGKLTAVLTHHEDDVFVIEAHPFDPRIFLSAGHDGHIVLWDVILRVPIKVFINQIEGQGHGSIFDCKFSPDGQFIASTDSHGHLTIYGFGTIDRYKKVPKEVFFHTDYRPLIRDSNNYVIDEQTQCAPHLMPPPFLVDIDGNPYEPTIQRLVPGRENCNDEQLVPYIAIQNERGVAEVLEPVIRPHEDGPQPLFPIQPPPSQESDHRTTIDDMIERLQQEHGYAALPSTSGGIRRRNNSQSVSGDTRNRVGFRANGDVEGVRQSSGNWQSRGNSGSATFPKRRTVVTPLKYSFVAKLRSQFLKYSNFEEHLYFTERSRKPLISPTVVKETITKERFTRRKKRIIQERQGVSRVQNGRRANWVSTSRRGIIDYENPEDLLTPEESGSNFSESNAESWEESSSESESESEEDDEEGWGFDNDPETARRNKKEGRKNASKRRKKVKKDDDSSSDEKRSKADDDEAAGRTEQSDSESSVTKPSAKIVQNKDIKLLRYPEWLISVTPKRSPYFPQIGDEVIYVRLGHECYLDAVRRQNEYKLHPRTQATKRKNVKDEQLVRITKIIYETLPPIVVNLSLLVIDDDGKDTNEMFVVRYHDMPDVLDFLVLQQSYIDAMNRNWQVNQRFRSIIDDKWWFGTIISKNEPIGNSNSSFQSLSVIWDNGESEHMSPWDIEPLDEDCNLRTGSDGIPISSDERIQVYSPKPYEWPPNGMDVECNRIIAGLEKIMETSWAEHFNAPVDLNAYQDYAQIVPYPIDLSTIKTRLENRMYRRLDALKFDVQHIEMNAKLYNEPKSDIRMKARIVSDLCMRFITDSNCEDPSIFIQDINHNKDMYESTENEDEENANDDKNARGGRRKKTKADVSQNKRSTDKKRREITSNTWRQQCRELVDLMFHSPDSEPFRFQVDPILYPDYTTVVDTPMDLSAVKEQLMTGCYNDPNEFCKDVRLIFANSRNYNTNKRSRIYSMTCRLKALFEEKVKSIISDYRYARSHEKKFKRQSTKKGKATKRISQKSHEKKEKKNGQRKKNFDPFNQPCSSNFNPSVVTNGFGKSKSVKRNSKIVEDDVKTTIDNESKPLVNGCVNGIVKNKTVCKRISDSDSDKEFNGTAALNNTNGELMCVQSDETRALNHDALTNHTNSETEIESEKNDTDATEIAESGVVKKGVKRKRKIPKRQIARKRPICTLRSRRKTVSLAVVSSDYSEGSADSPFTVTTDSSESCVVSRASNSGSEVSESDGGLSTRRARNKTVNYTERMDSDYEYELINRQEKSSRGRVIKPKGHTRAGINC